MGPFLTIRTPESCFLAAAGEFSRGVLVAYTRRDEPNDLRMGPRSRGSFHFVASRVGRSSVKVTCPSCGRVAAGADIDLANKVAVCRACSDVFHFSVKADRSDLAKPVRLRWKESRAADGSWRSVEETRAYAITFLFLGSVLLAIASSFIGMGHSAVSSRSILPLWSYFLFGVPIVCVTYMVLAQLLNKRKADFSDGTFRFQHGPLPMFSNIVLPVSDIADFVTSVHSESEGIRMDSAFVRERSGRTRRLWIGGRPGGPADVAEFVVARLNDELEQARRPNRVSGYRGNARIAEAELAAESELAAEYEDAESEPVRSKESR